jgi:hypothetical protein
MAERSFYFERLYPLQDALLGALRPLETGFYLTGGTAASRAYLQHRFSDDLDFFVNDDRRFGLWADRVLQALAGHPGGDLTVTLREERFVRCVMSVGDVPLKVEMVNDVPAHVGEVRTHPVLGRVDSPENILANKLTALVDRQEPKDLADVWGFCIRMGLSLGEALRGAQGKAVGLFAPDVARVLLGTTAADWQLVRWIDPPDAGRWVADLHRLGDGLLLGG